jgi:hypothetical protein
MIFENRVLRGLFESKSEDVKGAWGKFCNDKLHVLCCLPKYGERGVSDTYRACLTNIYINLSKETATGVT